MPKTLQSNDKNTQNTQEESIPYRKQIRKQVENVKELQEKASL